MNKLSIIFCLLIVAITDVLYAQVTFATEDIPKDLLVRANAVVRDETIHLELRSDKEVIETVSRSITILNNRGTDYAAISLYYNKSKSIKSLKGEIFNEHGFLISKFSLKNFSDQSATDNVSMFADYRVKSYNPSIQEYPYTIVYTYEIKHNQSLAIPDWRPNYFDDVAIQQSKYVFAAAPSNELRIKTQNLQKDPQIAQTEKLKTHSFVVNNIQARKPEPYSESIDLTCIQVRILPKTFSYYNKKSTVNDWNEFGKWVYDDLLADKRQLPESTVQEIKIRLSELKTDQEKARFLYKYMQNKTRYISIQIGIGGLEPFSAQYVDELSYGDCKALVNYMQALLDIANIPSYYCIVEAGNRKVDLDIDFANAGDGNHIILCIPFANDTTWLECTNNKIPYGFLGDFTDDRLVLACTAEGGKILRTPKYTANDNLQLRNSHFEIQEDGSLKGTVKTYFSGTQFDNHFYNQFLSPSELTKRLKQQYDVDNVVFEKANYVMNEDTTPTLEENLEIFVKSYVVKSENAKLIHPNLFSIGRAIPENKDRKKPVYINRGYTDIDSILFDLPADVISNIQPENKILEAPMGRYEMKTSIKDHKLHFYRKFQLFEGTYPAESYTDFSRLMKDASSLDRGRYKLLLKSEK